jgi:hypothetical protein
MTLYNLLRRITRRHIPEDDTLHNHRCENLKILHLNQCFSTIGLQQAFTSLKNLFLKLLENVIHLKKNALPYRLPLHSMCM